MSKKTSVLTYTKIKVIERWFRKWSTEITAGGKFIPLMRRKDVMEMIARETGIAVTWTNVRHLHEIGVIRIPYTHEKVSYLGLLAGYLPEDAEVWSHAEIQRWFADRNVNVSQMTVANARSQGLLPYRPAAPTATQPELPTNAPTVSEDWLGLFKTLMSIGEEIAKLKDQVRGQSAKLDVLLAELGATKGGDA